MSENKKEANKAPKIQQTDFSFRISEKDLRDNLSKKEIKAFFDEMKRLGNEGNSRHAFAKAAFTKVVIEHKKGIPMEEAIVVNEDSEEGLHWKLLIKKVKELGVENVLTQLMVGNLQVATLQVTDNVVEKVVEQEDNDREQLLEQLKEMEEKMKKMKEETEKTAETNKNETKTGEKEPTKTNTENNEDDNTTIKSGGETDVNDDDIAGLL